MHQAGQFLLGENDFSSFRAAQCQSNTPWRNVHHLNVVRKGSTLLWIFKPMLLCTIWYAILWGSLIEVGAGNQPVEWMKWLLEQKIVN